MGTLSILCVTRGEECILTLLRKMRRDANEVEAKFVVARDRVNDIKILAAGVAPDELFRVKSQGYIESVLDESLERMTPSDYVLRLDDDESMSDGMIEWLRERKFETHPHWKFNRAHLWQDDRHVIVNPPLWPDHQTRLSTREMSVGRNSIHCGSPFGGGELAPYDCVILHHKFLVKSLDERTEIVNRYDRVHPGAGTCFAPFSVPERVYAPDELDIHSLADLVKGDIQNG